MQYKRERKELRRNLEILIGQSESLNRVNKEIIGKKNILNVEMEDE